jgi:hypothetical protein
MGDFLRQFASSLQDPNQCVDPDADQPNQSVDPHAGQPDQSVDPNADQPNQTVDPSAAQPNQSVDPNTDQPNQSVDPNADQPNQCVDPNAGPDQSVDPNAAQPNQSGDPNADQPNQCVDPNGSQSDPSGDLRGGGSDRPADNQDRSNDSDDGIPPGGTSDSGSDPEDKDDPYGEQQPEHWEGSRGLTASERSKAESVYQDSIDYDKVSITAGSVGSTGSTRTIGNTIYMEDDEFQGSTSELTADGLNTLIHELGHVWQYQHGGLDYIPNALKAQLESTIVTGDRNDAYDWRRAVKNNREWKDWNAEQQAEAMEDYFKAEQRIKAAQDAGNSPAPEDEQIVKTLEPYVGKVRSGVGAPGGPSDEPGDYEPSRGDTAPA